MAAKILIVDDDPTMREVLDIFLSMEGYQTMVAIHGMDALHQVGAEQPDMILLDVSMPPGLNGYDVCQRLKSDPRTAHIPVTFLTFQDDLEERQRGIAAGASDYLTKPVDYDVLKNHVEAQLRVVQQPEQFETPDSVFFTLAMTAEAKDTYTSGHLRRMEYYCRRLAMAVGMTGEELVAIRYGAILHDIGKIRISDTILTKPGPLNPEEFAALKQHTNHGAQLVSHIRFADKVIPIVLGHHEKWDGTGYPHGLRGTDIPIGARIVAIADAYDAMTTDRPYRKALSQLEALRRLRAKRGIQWDPQLVDMFCALIEHERPVQSPVNHLVLEKAVV